MDAKKIGTKATTIEELSDRVIALEEETLRLHAVICRLEATLRQSPRPAPRPLPRPNRLVNLRTGG